MARSRREIDASGAVVLRGTYPARELLVIHRPRYDDWSLPKGKVEPDEYLPVTAVREVLEETGFRIRLRRQLTTVRYPISAGTKMVTWWAGELADDRQGNHDAEADRVEWWPIEQAVAELSYADEVAAVTETLRSPAGPALLVVRHAKAMNRRAWQGVDADRRLTERGRRQAKALAGLLAAFGVRHLASSTSTRCIKTLAPYAQQAGLEIAPVRALSEESAEANPGGVGKAMAKLRRRLLTTGEPLAVCGHRPVLPAMFEFLGVTPRRTLKPAELVVITVSGRDSAGPALHIAPKL